MGRSAAAPAGAAIKAFHRNGIANPFVATMLTMVMVSVVAAATAAFAMIVLMLFAAAGIVFVIFAVAKRRITAVNGHI